MTIYFVIKKINKRFEKKHKLLFDGVLTKKAKRIVISYIVIGLLFAVVLYKLNYFRLLLAGICVVYGLLRLNLQFRLEIGRPWLGLLFILAGLLIYLFPVYDLIIWASAFGGLHIIYGLITLSHPQNSEGS